MSLTREEWIEMWKYITSIEFQIKLLKKDSIRKEHAIPIIELDIDDVKKLIQSVIGQME